MGATETQSALACGHCGAGLPPPDVSGASTCVYCGAEHRSDRTSEILAVALAATGENPSLNSDSGIVPAIPSDSPSRGLVGEDAARIPMTEEAVRTLLRRHFSDAEAVFVCPHVPPKKEIAARKAHAGYLPDRERILALYDATWFGGGEEGFLVTARRLCWKNANEGAGSIEWRDLDPDQLYAHGRRLFVGMDVVMIHDEAILDACADAFHVLALSAMPRPLASGLVPAMESSSPMMMESPPPAQVKTTSGVEQKLDCACWKCRTPLQETTPQCSYCGAKPTKRKSWLRTGS